MLDYLSQPMPWYVAGPLIGLTLPLLLIVGNKTFGISSSFQHMCAAVLPKSFLTSITIGNQKGNGTYSFHLE